MSSDQQRDRQISQNQLSIQSLIDSAKNANELPKLDIPIQDNDVFIVRANGVTYHITKSDLFGSIKGEATLLSFLENILSVGVDNQETPLSVDLSSLDQSEEVLDLEEELKEIKETPSGLVLFDLKGSELWLSVDGIMPTRVDLATLSNILGTGLLNVSLGTPNTDATLPAYRSGKTGFGSETNPQEDIDLVGSSKMEYTYVNGVISRVALGGEEIASEIGYPTGSIKGQFLSISPKSGTQEATDGMVATFLQADLSAIGQANLLAQFGLQKNDNTRYANLIARKNNTNDGYQMGIQFFNNSKDERGWVRCYELGEGAGFDQEPIIESSIDMGAAGDYSRVKASPHLYNMDVSLVTLNRYKDGSRSEGFVNGDSVAKTGTAATVLKAPKYALNIDEDGSMVTTPITEKTIKVTITPSQIRAASQYINGSSNPSITPVVLVPDPIDGSAVVATEVLCKYTPTSDMYNSDGGRGYIMPNKDVSLVLDHADDYFQFRITDSFLSTNYGDEPLGTSRYEIAHRQDKATPSGSGSGYNSFEEGKGIVFLFGDDYYDAYPGVSIEMMITYKTIKF